MPLLELIGRFHPRLLSLTSGYASLDYYQSDSSQPVDLVLVGILLNGEPVDVLTSLQPRCKSLALGRSWAKKLASMLPRQQFPIAIQATVGGRVVARETVSAMRKDVTAKCVI